MLGIPLTEINEQSVGSAVPVLLGERFPTSSVPAIGGRGGRLPQQGDPSLGSPHHGHDPGLLRPGLPLQPLQRGLASRGLSLNPVVIRHSLNDRL